MSENSIIMKHIKWILAVAAIMISGEYSSNAQTLNTLTIPASTPEIRYVGRTLTSGDGSVSFNWSGVYLDMRFRGSLCRMRGGDRGVSHFNLFIDGKFDRIVSLTTQDTVVTLFEGLPDEHTLRLQKRSEGNFSKCTIKNFEMAAGTLLLPVQNIPTRRIEVIGDSYTCGYGTESFSKTDPWDPYTEDCNDAYGCIIARYFGADYHLISHSGYGIVRNYNDRKTSSVLTMRQEYMNTFDDDYDIPWDFSASTFHPDVVIINLGTNDWSTEPHPSLNTVKEGFRDLIARIRAAHGEEIPIVCVMYEWGFPYFEKIRNELNITLVPIIAEDYRNPEKDLGASWHPNMFGQRKMASLIIPYVSTVTGWDMKAVE